MPSAVQRRSHGLEVVNHEPEVARVVSRLRPALRERKELITHIEEGHPRRAAPHSNSNRRP